MNSEAISCPAYNDSSPWGVRGWGGVLLENSISGVSLVALRVVWCEQQEQADQANELMKYFGEVFPATQPAG